MVWKIIQEVVDEVKQAKDVDTKYSSIIYQDNTWEVQVELNSRSEDTLLKGLQFKVGYNGAFEDIKFSVRLGNKHSWKEWGKDLANTIKLEDNLDNTAIRVLPISNKSIDIPKIIEQQIISIIKLNYNN